MLTNFSGHQAFKNTVQQLENEIKRVLLREGRDNSSSPQAAEKATLFSLPLEMQATIFESLDPHSLKDKANFVDAASYFIGYFAKVYPTKEPKLPEIVNDLLFLFSPFIPSTASLSLVGKIVKYRPLITAVLRELTRRNSIPDSGLPMLSTP